MSEKAKKVLPETVDILTAVRKIDPEEMKKNSMEVRAVAFNEVMDEMVMRFGVTVRTEIKLYDLFAHIKQKEFEKAVADEKAKQEKK